MRFDKTSSDQVFELNGWLIKIPHSSSLSPVLHLTRHGNPSPEIVDRYLTQRQGAGGILNDLRRVLTGRGFPIIVKPVGEKWHTDLGGKPTLRCGFSSNEPSMQPYIDRLNDPINWLMQQKLAGLNLHDFLQSLYSDDTITEETRQYCLNKLSRDILYELLEMHRDHAHGDVKPENIMVEFQGDIDSLLKTEEPRFQVSFIDFDNAHPNDADGQAYAENGGRDMRWTLTGKTFREKDCAAFCCIVYAMYHTASQGNYHNSGLFVAIDTAPPDLSNSANPITDEPIQHLIRAMRTGQLRSRQEIIQFCKSKRILDRKRLQQLESETYPITASLQDPNEKPFLDAQEVLQRFIEAEKRSTLLAYKKPANEDVDDNVYDGPLVLNWEQSDAFVARLPEELKQTAQKAITDAIAGLAKERRIDLGDERGGGAAEETDAMTEQPTQLAAAQLGPWAITGITAASFFTAGLVAVGISAGIVGWQLAATITLAAIAAACWPVAVATVAILVLATALAAIIAHCKQDQQTTTIEDPNDFQTNQQRVRRESRTTSGVLVLSAKATTRLRSQTTCHTTNPPISRNNRQRSKTSLGKQGKPRGTTPHP